jgi:hypothetical protein
MINDHITDQISLHTYVQIPPRSVFIHIGTHYNEVWEIPNGYVRINKGEQENMCYFFPEENMYLEFVSCKLAEATMSDLTTLNNSQSVGLV